MNTRVVALAHINKKYENGEEFKVESMNSVAQSADHLVNRLMS